MFRILRGQEREYPIGCCRLGHDLITRIVPERFAASYQRFAQSCSSTPNLTNRPMKALDLSQQGRDIVSNKLISYVPRRMNIPEFSPVNDETKALNKTGLPSPR